MDVNTTTTSTGRRAGGEQELGPHRVGETLGAWRTAELRVARGFPECRGLSAEQLEDLYQETVIALLARPYVSEAHLRNALRQGVRHRALNLHRDTRRHGQILAEHAPHMRSSASAQAERSSPEQAAVRSEERTLILEFLSELDPFERRVFELTADGHGYRSVAKRLGVEELRARRAARSVERKRKLFRLRHGDDSAPSSRAPRTPLALTPLPWLAAGYTTVRRWLLGSGLSAKAGAAAATVVVITSGATALVGTRHRRPDRRIPVSRGLGRGGEGVAHRVPSSRRPRLFRNAVARPRRTVRASARVQRPPSVRAARPAARPPVGVEPSYSEREFGFE